MALEIVIHGAEQLGVLYDVIEEEVHTAQEQQIPIQLRQERGVLTTAIWISIGKIVEPYIKEFLTTFIKRIANNIADRLTKKDTIQPFKIVVDGTTYMMPDDLERLRNEVVHS